MLPTLGHRPTPRPAVLTVTQVNQQAKQLLERAFSSVAVVGEVSNLKTVSGHRYFSLKDASAQLPAVLFRRDAEALRFDLEAGMEVVATGRLTVYGPYGRYQMVVNRLEPRGAGALQVAFEQLKARLAAEGLFAAERKRPLPVLPRVVAVVTSPTGAVIRDIVNVATRRFCGAHILVIPTRVQGAEAAPSIADAIGRAGTLAEVHGIDVIVVARGGGSLEDLWGFNDERVARAVAAAPVPVVSAVGHETDFTIADFVADRRAPTPSAAAELVFPHKRELLSSIGRLRDRAAHALGRDLGRQRLRVQALRARLGDARGLAREQSQRLSYAQSALVQGARRVIAEHRSRLERADARLAKAHPRVRVQRIKDGLQNARARVAYAMRQQLARDRQRAAAAMQRLDALSPLAVLGRGYAIALKQDGSAVRDASEVSQGDPLEIRVRQGRIRATVD